MLIHPNSKIYIHVEPTDMRKSFDSLAQLVQLASLQDPLSGAWFLFRSKRGDRLKILYWDTDGYALWYKRLEVGTFEFPKWDPPQQSIEISARQLNLILSGIDLTARQRKRYSRPTTSANFP